jgi:hypothetical protein
VGEGEEKTLTPDPHSHPHPPTPLTLTHPHPFPNLIALELNIQHPFLHDLLKHKHENDLVETILARIN